MNYIAFEKALIEYPVFSVKDIIKRFPDFDNRRLVEWQRKGYLTKVRRGYYCFTDSISGEKFSYFTANKIYTPSYISLESALSYYNLIPEGVFMTISVTTRNTTAYNTGIGNFAYRHIKPTLFFGYKLLKEKKITIKIAEPEKVILDYFYLNTLNTKEAIEEIRFNKEQISALLNFTKLEKYQRIFGSKILDKRIRILANIINA
jgi:predicted transcriptional regulator of viral defense system